MAKVLFFATLLAFAVAVCADTCEFHLVDGQGKPVDWGTREIMYGYMGGQQTPTFTADVPEGSSLLLSSYLLLNDGGKITSPSPGVTINGHTITVNVQPIADSLYCARALAWADGKLYVAESESIDGKDNAVWVFATEATTGERLATVNHPRALAVSATTLYVLGEEELAAFDLKTHAKKYTQPLSYGKGVNQMALIADRLYLGDSIDACVRILDAASGAPRGQFTGEGENTLATGGYAALGLAATPQGHLVVCDAAGLREFTVDGVCVRKIAAIRGGASVAVDAQGNLALGVACAADPDYTYTPEVWKLAPDGKPLARIVRVYMSGPRPDPAYRLGYFNGMTGAIASPGGVAFDAGGNLYVSNYNRWPQGKDGVYYAPQILLDGGVVKCSPSGETLARLGSRYTGGTLLQTRLAQRVQRPPLQRTARVLHNGGTLQVLAWGDSITQCGGNWNGGASDTAHNWVHVLARQLEATFPAVKVKEEANGVGGQNAAEGHMRDPIGRYYRQPELELLEFGTNDADFHHYSPQRYAEELRGMLRELFALTDSDVVILTVGPLQGHTKAGTEDDYIAAAQAVGKEFNVPVVNISAAMHKKLAENGGVPFEHYHLAADNVHPNDAGHAVWAQAVLATLLDAAKQL